jgi:septin family protein
MEDIEHYDIPVYNFPYDVEEDDEDTIQDNSELRVSLSLFLTCAMWADSRAGPVL